MRRVIVVSIVFVGVMSALLVIPQVRAVAGAILASSAVLAIVIGFAAQRTIGNFIAGLLIAFTQPIRLGDEIEFTGTRGIVEEVGLIYTWVTTPDDDHMVIPNEMLVSDTLKNSTIRNEQPLAQITVRIPLSADLRAAVSALESQADDVVVSQLAEQVAVVAVRRVVKDGERIERVQSELRLEVSETLRAAGITGVAE